MNKRALNHLAITFLSVAGGLTIATCFGAAFDQAWAEALITPENGGPFSVGIVALIVIGVVMLIVADVSSWS